VEQGHDEHEPATPAVENLELLMGDASQDGDEVPFGSTCSIASVCIVDGVSPVVSDLTR
jgi:hypothetical protein